MPQIALVTDSTASLPEEMYGRYQLSMVPYYVHLAGRVAHDLVDISPDEMNRYLARLPIQAELPKTASPNPGEYLRVFLAAAERARAVISFHMTSQGSGAYQAALVAKDLAQQRQPDLDIQVVDTRNVSMCTGWMVLQAARAALAGAGMPEILDLVRRMIPVTRMVQTADTLRYLYMGGRIGRAKHLLGSLLSIRPLISMERGEIVVLGVARTREEAYRRMAAQVEKAVGPGGRVRVAMTHAAARAEAESLFALVKKVVTVVEVLWCELSPALAVHSGPGTVGLCFQPEHV